MGLGDLWDWVDEKIIDPITDPIKEIVGEAVEWSSLGLIDDDQVEQFLSDPFGEIEDWYKEAVGELTGEDEEEAARALAATNAEFIMLEYEETRRRAELEFDQMMNYVEGVQATSGLKKSSESFVAYNQETREAFQAELDWMDKSAVSRSNIALAGGEVAAEQAKWGVMTGWFSIGSSVGSFFL